MADFPSHSFTTEEVPSITSDRIAPSGRPRMADTDKLLPCPFCGGEATLNHGATDDFDVSCRNRKCFGPRTSPCAFSEDAIAMWNRRASTGEAVAWKQALGAARSFIANAPHDDHCFTNAPNPDACRCVCDKDSLLDFIDETMLASSRGDTEGIIEEIAAERRRQVESEGWTPEHDDEHTHEELARAAACYARPDDISWSDNFGRALDRDGNVRPMSWDETSRKWSYVLALRWPWARAWWKPTDRRRNLIKAGALIVAEIERLDRAALTAALRSTKP